jgi:hypothetical protein
MNRNVLIPGSGGGGHGVIYIGFCSLLGVTCGTIYILLTEDPPKHLLVAMLVGGGIGAIIGWIWRLLDHSSQNAIIPKNISGTRVDRDTEKSMAQIHGSDRTWAVIGYTILFGLVVTLVGAILRFFVPDWRPLLIAAGGMLFVVIALWHGRSLTQR